jgi:hypothetical protein
MQTTTGATMPPQKKTDHADFASAIAAAQADMTNAVKDSKNPHFKSNYASLSAVRDIVVPAFNKHGIAVLQPVDGADGFMTGRTLLMWKDQTLEMGNCTLPIGNSRNAAQAVGSAATYLARYQLRGVGCIAVEDDDGESYKAPQRPQRPQQAKPVLQGPPAQDGPNCPKCNSVLKVNINYRAWLKTLSPDERKQAKDKPALCCSNWKNCNFQEWTTDDAQQALQKLATFDDGLNE